MSLMTKYKEIKPYITKDGSIIRELLHPDIQGNKNQSLAEATVLEGSETELHRHMATEEIYHITKGKGLMTLGAQQFDVKVRETVCILPGTPHRIKNTGDSLLKVLCCCSPAYSHEDTELLTAEGDG